MNTSKTDDRLMARHDFLFSVVIHYFNLYQDIYGQINHHQDYISTRYSLFVLHLFHMCFFLLTITHAVVGFSCLLE